jgi:aminoglycoside phosphotransferase (APT) family kinase protein
VHRLAAENWHRFAEVVPSDVFGAVNWVHTHVDEFAARLAQWPSTFLHGDLKVSNLGFHDDRVVMLDWGTQTTWAPPAVDFAWFLAINSAAFDATLDELLADVRAAGGSDYDDDAMRVALLGAFSQLGWEKVWGATAGSDLAKRAREHAGLAWWYDRVREAAELLSLP